MGDLFRHTCLLLQAMKHRCWILLMWWKPVSLSDHVWVSLADTENGKVHCFFCISQAKQVEMRTVGCVFLVKMCIYNVISGWHFFYIRKFTAEKQSYSISSHKIQTVFFYANIRLLPLSLSLISAVLYGTPWLLHFMLLHPCILSMHMFVFLLCSAPVQ